MAFNDILSAIAEHGGLGVSRSAMQDDMDLPITAAGAKDYAKGLGAGVAGMPGDMAGLVNALMQMKRGVPVQAADFDFEYGTDALGKALGADVESGEFMMGSMGLPGLEDLLKAGTMAGMVVKVGKSAKPSKLGDLVNAISDRETVIRIPIGDIEHGESAMPGGKLDFQGAKDLIKQYADMPSDIPPISAWLNEPDDFGAKWMINDGSHRLEAAKLRGDDSILAAVLKEDMPPLPMDEASRMSRAKEMGFDTDVFHGTTHDIDAFDLSKASPEGDWGAGIYGTTHAGDASSNYSHIDAPDITIKIDRRAAELADDMDADAAYQQAVKEISGGEENILPLKVRAKKPYRVGGDNPSFLESEYPVSAPEDFLDDAKSMVDEADFDTPEEYTSALMEQAEELAVENSYEFDPEGKLVDFVESLRYSGHDTDELINTIYEAGGYDGGISSDKLDEIMRNTEWYAEDDFGNIVNNEVYRQALQDSGFDSVIDSNVYDKFGGGSGRMNAMEGIGPTTEHVVLFNPKQARRINAKFDPAKKDSANLMAGAAGGGLVAALIGQQDGTETNDIY